MISLDKGFVATHNTPSKVEKTLKRMFNELYGVSMRQYSFNDEVLGLICDVENIKSASFVNLSKDEKIPDKVRYSDSDLSAKIKELKQGTQEYTNSLYNEDLIDKDGNVHTVTLGVNSKAGKVHIKQNLSHSMFLETSIRKISEIIQYFSLDTDEGIFRKIQGLNLFTTGAFSRADSEKRDILYKLATAIKTCKDSDESETLFNIASMNVFKYFQADINIQYFIQCKNCDDLEVAHCPECKRSNLRINKDNNKIHCNFCRKDITHLECDESHEKYISDVNDIIHLALTENLSSKIIEELRLFSPELRFDSAEVIVISYGKLRIMKNSDYSIANPHDITEFNAIHSLKFDENQMNTALTAFGKIGEKCSNSY